MTKSPTREEILQDPEARKITGFKMTKLFFAETPEAVDAYIEAGVDINHQDISKETALDWTINRIVRDINTYEDSDNKGAVLQMALKGGKCSEESLEQLKDKDPEFHIRVVSVMKTRERLHELGAKIVTGRQNSGHADNPLEKVNQPENLTLIKDSTKHKTLHESPTHEKAHTENQQPISHKEAKELGIKPRLEIERIWGPRELPDIKITEVYDEKKRQNSGHADNPLEKVNQPENLTLIKDSTKHETLHELPTHEKAHTENQRSISHKEAKELGIKPHLKRSFEGPNLEPTLTITAVYDENEVAQKRAEFKLKDLMNRATLVEVDYGANTNWSLNVDTLCKKMEQVAKTGPVKAEESGRMFVAEKGSDLSQILHAWKEQTYKPWLEERRQRGVPAESMLDFLDMHDQETKIDVSASSYMQAAMVEQIVEHHPEHIGKISMLQLLNAYEKSGKQNADVIGKALQDKAREYIYTFDKETFPPTLENMVTLNTNRDKLASALATGNVSMFNLVHRIAYTELKMLKSLKSEDLEFVSNKTISEGLKIADKHKDAGNFSKIFTDEIAKREIKAKNKTFDPRDL